ncbi:MAG: hypothetical protein WC617_12645 [Rhodanobacter sp.]|jgi:hypothetical protein
MNKKRRKQLEVLKDRIDQLLLLAEEIRAEAEGIRDAEQDYRGSMPESIANSDKGERADAAIEALDEVIENLNGIGELEFLSLLETAAE